MANPTRETLFKPNLTKTESKAEAVSRIAMSMIEQETARRDAKTARLREARLAQEAASQPAKTVPGANSAAQAKSASRTKTRRAK
ncbi:hypothetical protein [Ancylobacter oerskovii]|uniref:Transcriptional regulator n=1 Tax=Ancylobacter oerskovii TaxID=459519 RepID=A0ABW4YVS7_9HYPH|nr:hypothetical protein [Ancylobacter oerskovii]MBS7543175.1 hypothetical protein [Ancylobacter oerskovii]